MVEGRYTKEGGILDSSRSLVEEEEEKGAVGRRNAYRERGKEGMEGKGDCGGGSITKIRRRN